MQRFKPTFPVGTSDNAKVYEFMQIPMFVRSFVPFLVVIAGVYLVFTSIRAWYKPFWYDEIITLLISRENSFAAVWKDETAGADYNPPLLYLLTHIAGQFGDRQELFVRLPAIAGYLV